MESSATTTYSSGLLALPKDILVTLPNFLHNIEDFVNLASTSRYLRLCMTAAHPHTILCLAWESRNVFFRPSPYYLVSAVAAQIGDWARESEANEAEFVAGMPKGMEHLMELALAKKQFGLTMERIRELHEMRFSVVNPIVDMMDKCVGKQWYSIPSFWNGGADDAYTIHSDPDSMVFLLAIYGELFGSDFEPYLNPSLPHKRTLKVETRLEYVKYCIPDIATECFKEAIDVRLPDGSYDPRRAIVIHEDGPYNNYYARNGEILKQNNMAMCWVIKSRRWRPHWKKVREEAGASPDFARDLDFLLYGTSYDDEDDVDVHWKQNMLEILMQCQGLEALGMVRSGTEIAERYKPKIREWREKIGRLETEPAKILVGRWETHEYPDLWGDLYICSSGYVSGT